MDGSRQMGRPLQRWRVETDAFWDLLHASRMQKTECHGKTSLHPTSGSVMAQQDDDDDDDIFLKNFR